MENPYVFLSTFIVFFPAVGALILVFFPRDSRDAMQLLHAGSHDRRLSAHAVDGAAGR